MQNLVLIGQLLDLPTRDARARARELLDWFDLTDAAGRPAKTYSGGMRRRLDLAASLVGRPSVIFLDEPTTGLDPAKREDMWDVVRRLVNDGSTVLLTTQYLDEADALADEITVIDHGRVIAHDTPHGLKHVVGGQTLEVRPTDPARAERGRRGSRRRHPQPRRIAAPGHVQRRGPDDSALPAATTRLAAPASPSPSSHFTCRAWTRCSSPSPGAERATTSRRRTPRRQHDRHPFPRAVVAAPAPVPPVTTRRFLIRHSVVVARRSLIKTWRTPEALIDVTSSRSSSSLLFAYVFGGAISGGSQHDYLQFLLPGLLGQWIAMGGISLGTNLNGDIEKGVFDRFRSLPIARSAPLVGAVLADFFRYLILCAVFVGFGYVIGFRIETNTVATVAAVAVSVGIRVVLLLDLGVGRHEGSHLRRGAGHHVASRASRCPSAAARSPDRARCRAGCKAFTRSTRSPIWSTWCVA